MIEENKEPYIIRTETYEQSVNRFSKEQEILTEEQPNSVQYVVYIPESELMK